MMAKDGEPRRVYQRDLAGGGFVAIDAAVRRSLLGRRRFVGSVIVERRSAPRRSSGAPAIARASADTIETVLQRLLPVALSDAAIGAAMVRFSSPCHGNRPEKERAPAPVR